MAAQPTGTVTFLFTDIEGSTQLWERQPEATRIALARHDAILRQAVEANQGIVVKTTGDGCHAAFEAAANAIAATVTAQQALSADPWSEIQPSGLRVRMGVHTGEAEIRAGDYFGPALNRAARLMATGHGGQVLVSASTAELVRDILPAETTLRDLGEHRLKDLIRPEHVFQLVHPALPSEFPPLKSLDAHPNNLPIQLTSFVGRERETGEVKELLSAARLITLTGSGGTGKTRLALHVAAEVLPSFTDGVWLIELAPLTEPGPIVQAMANTFELRGVPGIPLANLVIDYLRGKNLLLILDNCEHLIEACARLADQLLHTCPGLKILASSREGLGIAGEVTYHVPSLSLLSAEDPTPQMLSASEATQLFIERVLAVNPRFAVTESNTPAIAQICHRLDGIPLALELAAARIKLFSAEQIASRLNDRFRLLTGGSRTALPRQQTLRAMIDWSYDLLSEPECQLLRRLAVFAGGWTFEAADAVCSDLDVLNLLYQLVHKSLVLMEEHQGQTRYHMLETIRQYARDKLVEADEGAATRDRHFEYFLSLTEEAKPGLLDNSAFDWIDLLDQDYENIRAALEWRQEKSPEDALRLISNMPFFWGFRVDDRREAVTFLRSLLARVESLPGDDPATLLRVDTRSKGLITMSLLLFGMGDQTAATAGFIEAIALERRLDDRFWLALSLSNRAVLARMEDDWDTVLSAAPEAMQLTMELNPEWWRVLALGTLAAAERYQGSEAKARLLDDEMRRYMSQINHPIFMPMSIGLGTEARMQGRLEDARTIFSEALRVSRRLGSKNLKISFLSELAHIRRLEGRLDEAERDYRELIVEWYDIGQRGAVANQLECLAFVARATDRLDRAARLFGAAEALRESAQMPMHNYEFDEYEPEVAALREGMDADAFAAAWAKGRAMSMAEAVRFAAEDEDN